MPALGAGITRTGDFATDISRLQSLARTAWLELTVADLGEAWWILHEAKTAVPARYADLTIAVRVAGKPGYINTRRLELRSSSCL